MSINHLCSDVFLTISLQKRLDMSNKPCVMVSGQLSFTYMILLSPYNSEMQRGQELIQKVRKGKWLPKVTLQVKEEAGPKFRTLGSRWKGPSIPKSGPEWAYIIQQVDGLRVIRNQVIVFPSKNVCKVDVREESSPQTPLVLLSQWDKFEAIVGWQGIPGMYRVGVCCSKQTGRDLSLCSSQHDV